ncbi:MAG TPA: polysaccharide biosynthesis tyrosine autokinase [Acidimicrobiales bacterium]|nr:polysaccharide biosynthesis tyrosine autokinase [Acidimicrobiales bacterium]
MAVSARAGMELRDYIAVLRRRKWLIVLATMLAGMAALGLAVIQKPVYQATVRLLLEPTRTVFESSSSQGTLDVQTEIQRLQSVPVQDAVRDKVGSAPPVSGIQVGTTRVMRLTTEASTPRRAAEFANAYADAYINYRVTQAVDQLEKAAVPVQAKLDALEKEILPLQEAIAAAPAGPQREAKSAELGPRISALLSVQTTFKSTLDKLQVDAALKSGGVQLVSPAAAPREPVRPTPARNAILGLSVGLMFGIAVAFLFEHLDDSIKSKDDLESTVANVTFLGVIPAVTSWRNRAEPRLVSKEEPSSPAAEAYRSLRTSIQFIGMDRKLQILQITSPNASEGKTTTLANLAVALTQAGKTVAVLSCDLRRPRIHEYFGVPNAVGFTSVLLGETPLAEALQRVPGIPRLLLLASGRLPPNPSELLSSRRTTQVFDALRSQFDVVLVDSPPVLPVTDAAVLSPQVDGTIVVAMAGQTNTKSLARAMEVLGNVEATIVGAVLNGASSDSGYGYGYGYGYALEEPARGRRTATRESTNGEAMAKITPASKADPS